MQRHFKPDNDHKLYYNGSNVTEASYTETWYGCKSTITVDFYDKISVETKISFGRTRCQEIESFLAESLLEKPKSEFDSLRSNTKSFPW